MLIDVFHTNGVDQRYQRRISCSGIDDVYHEFTPRRRERSIRSAWIMTFPETARANMDILHRLLYTSLQGVCCRTFVVRCRDKYSCRSQPKKASTIYRVYAIQTLSVYAGSLLRHSWTHRYLEHMMIDTQLDTSAWQDTVNSLEAHNQIQGDILHNLLSTVYLCLLLQALLTHLKQALAPWS